MGACPEFRFVARVEQPDSDGTVVVDLVRDDLVITIAGDELAEPMGGDSDGMRPIDAFTAGHRQVERACAVAGGGAAGVRIERVFGAVDRDALLAVRAGVDQEPAVAMTEERPRQPPLDLPSGALPQAIGANGPAVGF